LQIGKGWQKTKSNHKGKLDNPRTICVGQKNLKKNLKRCVEGFEERGVLKQN
jgi:hypothetical protein